jgi:Na+/H+ antiporter NhaD/arsenite permease-like protein
MAIANILGDSFVIFLLSRFFLLTSLLTLLSDNTDFNLISGISSNFAFISTLEMVAIITIMFTIIGIIIGYRFLNQEINIQFKYLFTEGWKFVLSILESIFGKIKIKKIL